MPEQETIRPSRRYGNHPITVDGFHLLVSVQGNKCAICKEQFDGNLKPNMDHNHSTGVLRGVLCSKCNFGLGFFRDDVQRLGSAIEYLQYHDKFPRPSRAITPAAPAKRFTEAFNKLRDEDCRRLQDTPHLFPFKVAASTLRKYVIKGKFSKTHGRRIHLEAFRGAGCARLITSVEAIRRFLRAIGEDV